MKRLALLFVILALLPGVSSAQGPLELNAEGEMFGDEGPGRLTFQYPDEWEFVVETDGYLVSRASLVEDFDFSEQDIMIILTEFSIQAVEYEYGENTDPVEYLNLVIADLTDGLDEVSTEEMTIGTFNTIHGVYETEGLEANVFGIYDEGMQPLVAIAVNLPGAFAAHEETVVAVLESITFDPTYSGQGGNTNTPLENIDLSNAQLLPPAGESVPVTLTANDEYMAFTFEAEADSLAFFRVRETISPDDDIMPSVLLLDGENRMVHRERSTQSSRSSVEGDMLYSSFSQFVIQFEESGSYSLLVGVNGVLRGGDPPVAADFELLYVPVTEVSGIEPIEVEHTSGQTHLFVTDEVFAGELFITASTADNTGLNLEVAALYLDEDTINMGNTSFAFGEPDSTVPVSVDVYNAPDEGQLGRVVIMVSEETLPREGELISGVETTLTITIEQKS